MQIESKELYDTYRIKIALRDRLCGGMPKNPDVIKTWVESTTGHKDKKSEELTEEALAVLVEETSEKCWNGFPGDDAGLFIWARNVKAMFKECASVLGIIKKKRGSRQVFQHGFEVKSLTEPFDRLHLGVEKPTNYEEAPIHVMTPQGPRTAIKRVDYVEKPILEFDLWVLKTATQETRHIGEKDLEQILALAQENGLGADRSQGHGKFDVVEFAKQ